MRANPVNTCSTRRSAILREMGLAPLWRLRSAADATTEIAPPAPVAATPIAEEAAATRQISLPPAFAPGSIQPVAVDNARAATIAALDWNGLRASIAACRACTLCQQRKQAVPGVGDTTANWLFVGEGPGAEEDERGEPFVGQAGKLLDAMLAAIGLRRDHDVYIANAVKCRPPGNRTPTPEEMAACRPYLERQIDLLQPRLIVALGRPAAQTLLQQEVKISAARGRIFQYRDISLLVTYHPAYLLRTLTDKAKAWEDLCLARRIMREERNAGQAG